MASGPGGIPGWIARLVDALYGAPAPRFGLDAPSRALVLDGRSVPLTRLEYGVMDYLAGNEGRVVTRDEMLREIWHQPFGGSNVVDAVIRTLRKKLRSDGRAIETLKGHGYRFRGFGSVVDSASP
jgi:DNA-binding response OmpR family regulator